jgi:hypothetical protein
MPGSDLFLQTKREVNLMQRLFPHYQRAYDLSMRLKGASDRSGLLENAVEWLAMESLCCERMAKSFTRTTQCFRSRSVAMASELPAEFLNLRATRHDAVLIRRSVPSRGLAMHPPTPRRLISLSCGPAGHLPTLFQCALSPVEKLAQCMATPM